MTTYDIKGALLIAFWILLGSGILWAVVYTAVRSALSDAWWDEEGMGWRQRLSNIEERLDLIAWRLPPEKDDE